MLFLEMFGVEGFIFYLMPFVRALVGAGAAIGKCLVEVASVSF